MLLNKNVSTIVITGLIAPGIWSLPAFATDPLFLDPAKMPAVAVVGERFQSFNIEMLEVTGGRLWKPYKDLKPSSTAAGPDADLYEYRPPIDLTRDRLRDLAAALGPAFLRVSGTWANSTYFQDTDSPVPEAPPKGFNGVLTRRQWKNVVDFGHVANAKLVVSFATSEGTRDPQGVWTPDQARALVAYTNAIGGRIDAAEFMNEPNVADRGGAPKGYDAAAYARDVAVFRAFLKQASPDTLFLGPGSVLEGGALRIPVNDELRSEKLLAATGLVFDAFSYHMYGALSQRCAGAIPGVGTTVEAALSEEWFSRTDAAQAYYGGLRNRWEPGRPIWVTESADTGCGGNPWASTFLDAFRYLDQHARLAQKGVQMIAHNTLAASDYGLLDETTLDPRPNYWAALLWRKLMGTTVLKPNDQAPGDARLYAHCMNNARGGVVLLAINADRTTSRTIRIPVPSERYTLTAPDLEGTRVDLNGKELKLGAGDSIPQLVGVTAPSGEISLPYASITFLAIRTAQNTSCR